MTEQIQRRLRTDPDSFVTWPGAELPVGSYESEEITGTRLHLMLDGCNDIYVITILPGDDHGLANVWLRRMDSTDAVHILTHRARDPRDTVIAALEALPDYIGII